MASVYEQSRLQEIESWKQWKVYNRTPGLVWEIENLERLGVWEIGSKFAKLYREKKQDHSFNLRISRDWSLSHQESSILNLMRISFVVNWKTCMWTDKVLNVWTLNVNLFSGQHLITALAEKMYGCPTTSWCVKVFFVNYGNNFFNNVFVFLILCRLCYLRRYTSMPES